MTIRTVRKAFAPEVIMGGQQSTIENALQELGLSQHEISLYRSALTLGPRPASTLAKSIKVQRTRVYDLLSSLQSRGLIDMMERNSVRYYAATSPDHLRSLVRERKRYLDNQLEQLEKAIPSLFGDCQKTFSTIESRTVRGAKLVREALNECLENEGITLLSIGDIEQVLRTRVGMSRWTEQFRDLRIARKISLRISIEGPPDFLEEKALLRETLFSPDIPKGILILASSDKLLVIDEGDAIQATQIESKLLCLVLNSLYSSWHSAVMRIA